MLAFLYGEDTYSIKKATQKSVANFIEKEKTDLNLNIIKANELTIENFVAAVYSTPFLGEKKLVIVENLLLEREKELKDKLKSKIEKIPEFTTLFFVEEGKPDQREGLFKYLNKTATTKYFGPVDESKMRQFIKEKMQPENVAIANDALSKLILFIGADLWRLENELQKLILFIKSEDRKEIKTGDVELMIEPNLNLKIFDLTDALALRNTQKVISLFQSMLKKGEDVFMIFNMIIYQLRNMLIVEDLIKRQVQRNELAKKAGLHPFVITKTEQSLRKFRAGEIVKFYNSLKETDWKVKSGQIELESAMDLLLVEFCESGKI